MVIYSYTNHKTYKNTNLKYDTLDNILKKEDYDQIEFLCFSQFSDYFDCSTGRPKNPEYFKSTELPDLPKNLKILECFGIGLTSLPELPDGLEISYCWRNKIGKLPMLPNTMTDISCHDNKLTSFPNMPKELRSLICSFNRIKQLPMIMPKNLEQLRCDFTNLKHIPYTLNLKNTSFNFQYVNVIFPFNRYYAYQWDKSMLQDYIAWEVQTIHKFVRKIEDWYIKIKQKREVRKIEDSYLTIRYNPEYVYCRKKVIKEYDDYYKGS